MSNQALHEAFNIDDQDCLLNKDSITSSAFIKTIKIFISVWIKIKGYQIYESSCISLKQRCFSSIFIIHAKKMGWNLDFRPREVHEDLWESKNWRED